MSTTTTRRRSLLAMAGAVAGVAATAVTPAGAAAQTNAPEPEGRTIVLEPEQLSPDPRSVPAPASHGICRSFTQYTVAGSSDRIYVPSTGRQNGQTHCTLGVGNQTEGVYKLQHALDLCPQPAQNVAVDGIYGSQTEAAVKRTQDYWGITPDGVYGPNTRSAMDWPVFNSNNDWTGRCVFVTNF